MTFSIIVAAAENGVIGNEGEMPWKRLPSDLKFFKQTTSGHWCILGRKTYHALGNKVLPNRKFLIVTRDPGFRSEDSEVVHDLSDALTSPLLCDEEEVFIIGGGQIYKQAEPYCSRIYLTRIHESFEGDTRFETPDPAKWEIESTQYVEANEKNPYNHTFITYSRKNQ
jgi:dihydrofolate reductase